MVRNLGTLTAVVMLSFLVSLGLSRGILAVVLKAMSCRIFSFTRSNTRLVTSSRAKSQWNFSSLNNTGGLLSVRSRRERAPTLSKSTTTWA
jgi:hypothetical protein